MALMREAMSKLDFERSEKGLPPLKSVLMERPKPPSPEVENEITMAHILDGYDVELESAKRRPIKNKDGMLFIGFDVVINLNPTLKKKGPGRPKETDDDKLEPRILAGWMNEGQFLSLVRTYRKQIDQQVIRG